AQDPNSRQNHDFRQGSTKVPTLDKTVTLDKEAQDPNSRQNHDLRQGSTRPQL
ncbi:hypothetical protein LOTGIDRAFT_134240, partial [Lottia gigantea]